jgi:uncharacterized protein
MQGPGRAVVDTNTFVSAALKPGSVPDQAVLKAFQNGPVLQSIDTWRELEDVLLRDKFERYKALAVRRNFLESLEGALESVSILTKVTACRHPKDDKFLELAVDGKADYVITGDKDLLTLHPFRGITILTPQAYLER